MARKKKSLEYRERTNGNYTSYNIPHLWCNGEWKIGTERCRLRAKLMANVSLQLLYYRLDVKLCPWPWCTKWLKSVHLWMIYAIHRKKISERPLVPRVRDSFGGNRANMLVARDLGFWLCANPLYTESCAWAKTCIVGWGTVTQAETQVRVKRNSKLVLDGLGDHGWAVAHEDDFEPCQSLDGYK